MAPNYYSELELERDASAKQINQAFRKLALKLHPDKHGGDEKALLAFAAVCEAYEVLSEPRHRALYDQFEEAGLKDGVPDGKGGLLGGTYRFSGDAQRIFETFFGSASPFGDIYGALTDPASAASDAGGPSFYGDLTTLAPPVRAGQPRPIAKTVAVTLGQLYRGDSLTVPHARKVLNGDGVTTRVVQDELHLVLRPGYAAGYKLVFAQKGDEGPAVVPADVIVTLKEASAADGYRRAGHDLIYTTRVALADALCGFILHVPTLDGRALSIGLTEIVKPGYVHVVKGEGMPIAAASDGRKGDLRIEFEIVFPTSLKPSQRQAVRALKM